MTNCGRHTVLLLEELQIGGREIGLATAELSMAKEGLCRGPLPDPIINDEVPAEVRPETRLRVLYRRTSSGVSEEKRDSLAGLDSCWDATKAVERNEE
jgi:hypothetical protein